jgi:hypothetical protein
MTKHATEPQTLNISHSPSDALQRHPGLDKEHLSLQCPACGTTGLLRINHLDRNFVCKHCNQVFHVTTVGLVPGKRARELSDPLRSADPYRMAPPVQGSTERFWNKLPRSFRILLGGGVLVGLLLLLGHLVSTRLNSASTVPDSLLDRATYVGRAYARNDSQAVALLVSPNMEQDARGWLAESRPTAWSKVSRDAVAKVSVTKLNVKRNLATATVTIAVTGVTGQLTTTLYWVPESPNSTRSLWLLDAKSTRQIAGKKRLTLHTTRDK